MEMSHCFKTSQLIKLSFGRGTRCVARKWNVTHHSSRVPASLPAPLAVPRLYSSLCLASPAAEQQLPMHAPRYQLARHLELLGRQLAELEAARQLQNTADPGLLRAAALSECERRAFREAALAERLPGERPPGERPPGERPPGEQPADAAQDPSRPTPDQLRAVEASLLTNLPRIFVMTQDFSIYHKDVVFDNRIRGTKTVGIVPYIKQCALLRIVGHIKFSFVTFDVLQSATHSDDDTVRVRWRIRGVSALKSMIMFWKVNVFKLSKTIDDDGVDWYDGYSIFQVGGDGKISTHIADKVMPDWSRQLARQPAAIGGLAALVYGLMPDGADLAAAPLERLGDLGQLVTLTARLERLERQIDTALPLSAGYFQTSGGI